jgi:hypothetical protein
MRGIRHIFLLSLVAATCAGAAEIRVRVIVPHTALHVRGDEASDVLGQASANQELLATGPLNAKWISVMPPDDVVVWIYAELVHDGRIITDKAQLRSTAGLKGAIIGSVDKDTPVVSHGRLGDWLKIQSPLPLYISRSAIELATNAVSIRLPSQVATGLLSALGSTNLPPADASTNALATNATASATTNIAPRVEAPARATLPPELAGLKLVATPHQGTRVHATGTLRRVIKNSTATTALYRITGNDRDGGLRTFCFIIGDNAQCEAYLNELVTIEGPAWWLVNESAPVIKMDRLVQEKP